MSHLTGAATLVRLAVRRDRVRLAVWLAAIVGLAWTQVVGLEGLYPEPGDLAEAAALVEGNAAFIAMAGPPVALDTLGGRTAFEIGAFGMVMAALMNVFFVTRHLRGDEEAGRAELLRSAVLGRHAALAATMCVAIAVDAVLAALLVLVLSSVGLPMAGSAALALGIAGTGLVFGGVAALSSQITTSTRAASSAAGAALAAAFVLRAVGDVGDGRLSWLSPLGWAQALRPFGGERWWAALIMVGALVLLVAVARAVSDRRDVGAGVVQPRPGPARAAPALLRPLGLALRLQRPTLVGWSVGLFLGGVAYGSIVSDVEDFVGDNETIADIVAQAGGDLVESFLSTTALVLALVGAAACVQAGLRMRSEEVAGRAEPILATATARRRWAASHLGVAAAGALAVLLAAGLGTGITYAVVAGDASQVPRLALASLVHAPAVLVLLGVTTVLFGLVPRFAAVAWATVAGAFVIGFFGDLLSLPRWVRDISPFTHVPALPADDLRALPLVVLSVIAAGLMAVGLAGLARRDIGA